MFQEGSWFLKTVYWEARVIAAPMTVRYCKHCGGRMPFACSGRFRINAQQKRLDIWLIYKCSACDTTWNLPVHERISPQALPQEMLSRYTNNDEELALLHATDTALLKQNGSEPGACEVSIAGEEADLSEETEIRLTAKLPTGIRIAAILREKLKLSRSAYERMCADGNIVCLSGHDLQKGKLNGDIIVQIKP